MKFQKAPAFFCLLFIYISAKAQLPAGSPGTNSGGKTQFLWYTGHWSPSNKYIFIVDRDSTGAGGATLTINPDGSIIETGGGQDQWNKKIDDGIKQINDAVGQLNKPSNNTDPDRYQMNQLLLADAQEQQQLWNNYKIEPGQNLLTPGIKPGNGSTGAKPGIASGTANKEEAKTESEAMNSLLTSFCKKSKTDFDAVVGYYKAHRKYNDADLNVPPPPEFEYSCYACDSNLRKSDDTTIAHYVRDFAHPEDSLISKGLEILRAAELMDLNNGVIPSDYYNAFEKGGACSYFSFSELSQAILGIAQHVYWRAEKLVDQYHNRFKAAEAICRTYTSVARFYILISGRTGDENEYLPKLASLVDSNFNYYFDKLSHNDWKQIGNITYDISLARQAAMLGSDVDYAFDQKLKEMAAVFNGFTLSIEMDVKTGKGNGYRISHLKGQCKVGPKFDRDSNQCYKWVVLDENRPDFQGFYQKKSEQTIDCQLIDNELLTPPQAPKLVYTGTKKYSAGLGELRIDFCNPGKDTITLSHFSPNPAGAGTWQVPYSAPQNLGVSGEEYFEDVHARKKRVQSGEAADAAARYKAQNEQMIKQMKEMAEKMKSQQGNKSPADYEKMQEMFTKIMTWAGTGLMAKMLSLEFEIPVQNNAAVLVHKIFNAKEINPQLGSVIVYGYYTIHIENQTNGPKKKAL